MQVYSAVGVSCCPSWQYAFEDVKMQYCSTGQTVDQLIEADEALKAVVTQGKALAQAAKNTMDICIASATECAARPAVAGADRRTRSRVDPTFCLFTTHRIYPFTCLCPPACLLARSPARQPAQLDPQPQPNAIPVPVPITIANPMPAQCSPYATRPL